MLMLHPAFTGAVAVLALNDHVLKSRYPGFVTGKLSDFAGVFALAVVVGLLTENRRVALIAVGAGFAAIKLSPDAARLAAPFLGGQTMQDPGDLIALAALWPAHVLLSSDTSTWHRQRWVPPFVVVAAVLTLTATSCGGGPRLDAFAIDSEGVVFGRIVDISTQVDSPVATWAKSEDGGHQWVPAGEPDAALSQRFATCNRNECFRISGFAVDEAGGPGEWRTSFAFSDEEVKRMRERKGGCGTPAVELASITTTRGPDGLHVLVAMGQQGVLHRLPSGEWERRAVLDLKPTSTFGPVWLRQLMVAPLLLALFGITLAAIAGWRFGGRRGRGVLGLSLGSAFFLLLLAGVMLLGDYAVGGLTISGLSTLVFLVSLWLAVHRPRIRLPDPPPRSGGPP
jgi:hypothetical protein